MRPPRPLEHCALCDEATGHAGAGEDSRFCLLTEKGPYCDQCNEIRNDAMVEALREMAERINDCTGPSDTMMCRQAHEGYYQDKWCPYCWARAKIAELGGEDGEEPSPRCETCGRTGRIPTRLQGSTTTQWHSKPCPDCGSGEEG